MRSDPEHVAADLRKILRGNVHADILHRAAYSTDASIYSIVPCCVVAPRDTADIVAAVQYAAQQHIPVVARGAGSGVAGESLCSGIVLDMTCFMNRIISVEDNGRTVTCEPGVVLDDLNNHLLPYGRKIGPDPSTSNRATIGGCVANNSTGAHSLEYGYLGDYLERVKVVLADSTTAEFTNDFDPAAAEQSAGSSIAQRCLSILTDKQAAIEEAMPHIRRNRSGYAIAGICHDGRIDMARLMAGSEGTLAIFTEVTLRTVEIPPAKALLQLEFDSLDKAAQAVRIIVGTGAVACELMDKTLNDMTRQALPQYRDILPGDAEAILLVEHTAKTPEEATKKIERTDAAVASLAKNRRVVLDQARQKRLWKSRKDAVPLLGRGKGRKQPIPFIEDVAVGGENLGEYVRQMQEIAKKHDIPMAFYGHAGDGELHVRPYLDLGDPSDVEKMRLIANDVYRLAWSLGGTISGEHADGLVRAAFIRRQYGDEIYNLFCRIKHTFDPAGLMNPGKIITDDPDVMTRNLRAEHHILPERAKSDLLFDKDELLFELQQCSGCGVCLSREPNLRMCPVFRALGQELAGSRAKANILRFWAGGQLDDKAFESPDFQKFLDLCINCRACSLECPSGVDVSKLITAARAEYVKRKGLRSAQLLLSRNRYLSMLGSTFKTLANPTTRLPITKWLLEKMAGFDRRRDLPPFAAGSFLSAGRKYLSKCQPCEHPIERVAYFVDTYACYHDHELAFAVVDVLRHNDIEVILPKQRPTPLPAICYGDIKTARRDLRYNVTHLAKAVRDGYKIICSEPSAVLCLQQELRHFVRTPDAELVSGNTFELMSYLLELHKQGKLKPVARRILQEFVYHCPCHLCAIGGVGASIELLDSLAGLPVTDLQSGCCGIAGTFGIQRKNYELSAKIAQPLAELLEASHVHHVLTECGACRMQIEHISNFDVTHPIKILAQAYGL